MEIDTIGTFAMSRAAFPALRQSGGGSIVNISATLHYGATWWQVLSCFRCILFWHVARVSRECGAMQNYITVTRHWMGIKWQVLIGFAVSLPG